MRRMLMLLGSLAGAAALSSCSGGGGSSSGGSGIVPVAPTSPYAQATPNPSLVTAPGSLCANPTNSQTLSVASNPQGAWVEITASGTTYVVGQTPLTCALDPSKTGVSVAVLGNVGQAPQVTNVAGNVSTSIFFNALGDSSGSMLAAGGTLSVMRSPSSAARAASAGAPRRAPQRYARGNGEVPGVYAVVYRSGALSMEGRTPAEIERALGAVGKKIGTLQGQEWRSIRVSPAQAAGVVAQLQARPDVEAVYPAHYRRLLALRPQDAAMSANDTFMDPYDQWDMFHIGMPAAWGITEGSAAAPIAIIDTGYDTHNQDLASKVIHEAVFYSGTGKMVIDNTNPDDPANIEDTDGHGTNVSGIAAAITNNGLGFAGVGWNTPLLEYKIFPDTDVNGVSCITSTDPSCGASTTDEAQAIAAAVQSGAKVINLSLGGSAGQPVDPTEYAAVEQAISQGVVVVAAAGNDTSSTGISYPGGYRGVISVGASAIHGDNCTAGIPPACDPSSGTEGLAAYSNYGPTADALTNAITVNQPTLVAPGGDPSGQSDNDNLHWIFNLYSTGVTLANYTCNPANSGGVCASFFAGTSQATPHVAGAVALMRAIAPSLTPAQILAIFQNPNNDDNLGIGASQGAGRLDVVKALEAAGGTVVAAQGTLPPLTSFVAMAYTPGQGNAPTILDKEYPLGVPVNSNGTFRLSDIPAGTTYEVGVWIDTNHDNVVDQGDWFGAAGNTAAPSVYSSNGMYSYGTITVQQVGPTFALR